MVEDRVQLWPFWETSYPSLDPTLTTGAVKTAVGLGKGESWWRRAGNEGGGNCESGGDSVCWILRIHQQPLHPFLSLDLRPRSMRIIAEEEAYGRKREFIFLFSDHTVRLQHLFGLLPVLSLSFFVFLSPFPLSSPLGFETLDFIVIWIWNTLFHCENKCTSATCFIWLLIGNGPEPHDTLNSPGTPCPFPWSLLSALITAIGTARWVFWCLWAIYKCPQNWACTHVVVYSWLLTSAGNVSNTN